MKKKNFLIRSFCWGREGGGMRRKGGGKVSGDKEGRGKELMKEMKALIAGARTSNFFREGSLYRT